MKYLVCTVSLFSLMTSSYLCPTTDTICTISKAPRTITAQVSAGYCVYTYRDHSMYFHYFIDGRHRLLFDQFTGCFINLILRLFHGLYLTVTFPYSLSTQKVYCILYLSFLLFDCHICCSLDTRSKTITGSLSVSTLNNSMGSYTKFILMLTNYMENAFIPVLTGSTLDPSRDD